MASASYGIALSITASDTGATLTLERATDAAFTVNHMTVYTKASGVISGTSYSYTDYLGVQTTIYYYRAKESKAGYVDSSYSGTISSAPYDLSI
jgi:hypothetical protein